MYSSTAKDYCLNGAFRIVLSVTQWQLSKHGEAHLDAEHHGGRIANHFEKSQHLAPLSIWSQY